MDHWGTTLIGIGVGFIFLQQSALLFVASILIGIGVGVVVVSLLEFRAIAMAEL